MKFSSITLAYFVASSIRHSFALKPKVHEGFLSKKDIEENFKSSDMGKADIMMMPTSVIQRFKEEISAEDLNIEEEDLVVVNVETITESTGEIKFRKPESKKRGNLVTHNTAYVFLNTNEDAFFQHSDYDKIPINEGDMVVFTGRDASSFEIGAGSVSYIGPLHTDSLLPMKRALSDTDCESDEKECNELGDYNSAACCETSDQCGTISAYDSYNICLPKTPEDCVNGEFDRTIELECSASSDSSSSDSSSSESGSDSSD